MRAVLSTSPRVIRAAMYAELAFMERRPELGLLCRTAAEHGHRLERGIVKAALPGVSDAGADNVLAWCRVLGLCDKGGGLTALGEEVARSSEAPVPEQGVYGFWLTRHPLMGARVLAVERMKSDRDVGFDDLQAPPYLPDCGRVFASLQDSNQRFVVRDLPSNSGPVLAVRGSTRAAVTLQWTLDFEHDQNRWHLSGTIEGPGAGQDTDLRPVQHQPESAELDLRRLADLWGCGPLAEHGFWDETARRLMLSVDDLQPHEWQSFCTDIELPEVVVPGKGTFHDVKLEDVPIGPRSPQGAQLWSMLRLGHRLAEDPAYRTRSDLFADFAAVVEGSPLQTHQPMLPAHTEMEQLLELGDHSSVYWAVNAPVDLAFHPVEDEQLCARSLPVVAPRKPVDPAGTIHVPFGAEWSMRKLVDRLVQGQSPARVLLCDPYVRRDTHHIALALFGDALRALSASSTLEVWTREEDTDLRAIERITGTRPRRYADVFGRHKPHDRYVLVEFEAGGRSAWQLSNSPLHPQTQVTRPSVETPLSWRDLSAVQAPAASLPSSLSRWLTGDAR